VIGGHLIERHGRNLREENTTSRIPQEAIATTNTIQGVSRVSTPGSITNGLGLTTSIVTRRYVADKDLVRGRGNARHVGVIAIVEPSRRRRGVLHVRIAVALVIHRK